MGIASLNPDFRILFESAPGLYLVLSPDLEIVAVTDAYCLATLTRREEILGNYLFDVFPDNPSDPEATGVSNLNRSLQTVLETKMPHTMAIQRYDIRKPGGNEFEIRYWSPVNAPVLDDKGGVSLIIHRVEDVTDLVRLRTNEAEGRRNSEELLKRAERVEAELKLILNSVRLFLWHGYVDEFEGRQRWQIVVADEQQAKRILPVELSPGQSWVQAWAASKLPEDRERSNLSSEEAFRSGLGRYTTEYRCRLATGEIRWFFEDVEITPKDPGVFEMLGATVDVTELKWAEQKVESERRMLQSVIDTLPDAVFVKDVRSRFVLSNVAHMQILGVLSQNDLAGKTDFDFFPSELARPFYDDEQALIHGEVDVVNKLETSQSKEGEDRWYWTSKVPLHDLNGNIEGIVGVNRNITSRIEEEKELKAALQAVEEARSTADHNARLLESEALKLQQANAELESFSYSVSHDLRAPLRHINGYVKMLGKETEGQLSETARRYLDTISTASNNMAQLIDDLLSFARMGRFDLQSGEVRLSEVAIDMIAAFDAESEGRRIHWRLSELPAVIGDRIMLKHVLTNLLGNAVKYTRNRDVAEIEIGIASRDSEEVVLFVRDNGVGFEMQYAHNLFGVFQRLHRADEFEGTGIGLAIVRRIINRHGGRTWAESELGKGATFYFSLKLAQANPE